MFEREKKCAWKESESWVISCCLRLANILPYIRHNMCYYQIKTDDHLFIKPKQAKDILTLLLHGALQQQFIKEQNHN